LEIFQKFPKNFQKKVENVDVKWKKNGKKMERKWKCPKNFHFISISFPLFEGSISDTVSTFFGLAVGSFCRENLPKFLPQKKSKT